MVKLRTRDSVVNDTLQVLGYYGKEVATICNHELKRLHEILGAYKAETSRQKEKDLYGRLRRKINKELSRRPDGKFPNMVVTYPEVTEEKAREMRRKTKLESWKVERK